MDETDLELLERFVRDNAEDAFARVVDRHLALVHSAALRQVRSSHLAQEVAQSVFVDLARNARCLPPSTVVVAWLYQVTRRTAIDVIRRESRRQIREQVAHELNAMNSTDPSWTRIEPLLEEAMESLDPADRTAVLLRYFENKSLREVGEALGTSENAAQKRLARAIERLHRFFGDKEVTVAVTGLALLLSTNAVQAAPLQMGGGIVFLAAQASVAAQEGAAAVGTTTTGGLKTVFMSTTQKALVASTLIPAVGTGIFEAQQASRLRTEVQRLESQGLALGNFEQITRERDEAQVKCSPEIRPVA